MIVKMYDSCGCGQGSTIPLQVKAGLWGYDLPFEGATTPAGFLGVGGELYLSENFGPWFEWGFFGTGHGRAGGSRFSVGAQVRF